MSKKLNKKRQEYAKKQEKQGQNVVTWIIVGLIVLALLVAFFNMRSFL